MALREKHPLAGKTVMLTLKSKPYEYLKTGAKFALEDWWQNVSGGSWMDAQGNPACLIYAMRSGFGAGVPTDNEVVYGKVGPLGYLVHVSELGPIATNTKEGN